MEDSGAGIARGVLPEILRLGFTTRSESGGQGVGLTIASEILKTLGAKLEIASQPGSGTTASIDLPPAVIMMRPNA